MWGRVRNDTRSALIAGFRPQLVPLASNLVAAVFPLMKIIPAAYCVHRAEEEGLISKGSVIVETSSGTMALGLAMVCNWLGYKLIVVSDPVCDAVLKRRMEDLGATVEIVSKPAAYGGYQRARLDLVHQICNSSCKHWWLNQYDNPDNAAAYATFAAQLAGELGRVDCLVGTVGSGGSICGTSSHLRLLFPDLHVAGVDTFGSILFGQPDAPRKLRGLGNSILPNNLDHTCFDEVHWITAEEAHAATRMLHRTTTLFRGGTSGACWIVARHWAEQHPDKRVVCLFPDDGYRYLDTIYQNSDEAAAIPARPREVASPLDAGPSWSCMQWNRRTLLEVAPKAQLAASK